MSSLKIVHIIEHFASAGPERSIIAAAQYATRAGLAQEHVVCTLEAAGSPVAVVLAGRAGIRVLLGPDRAELHRQLSAADIVQVHFWNNPALYAFLRSDLPAMRLLIWSMVMGDRAPQALTRQLVDFADRFAATSPGTLALPALQASTAGGRAVASSFIPGIADLDRLNGFTPRAHEGFVVGYIGVVNFTKLHPDYVAMSAAVPSAAVRFDVAGTGGQEVLQQQAEALGVDHRFTFRGYVENIRSHLEGCDIFGYPLRPETYATSEKALQEAMWVGLPPVVFPYGGVRFLVENGVTGLVVDSPEAYTAAVERLYQEPVIRRDLAHNAQEYARTAFDPLHAVQQLAGIYTALMDRPKRARTWPDDGARPAEWFVAALGDLAGPFAVSLASGTGPALAAAEMEIAGASELLLHGEGGIVHYYNRYPDDPYLRHWAELALAARSRLPNG